MTGSNTYFCANGIIAADRKVHPSAYEVKKVYAEMKVIEKTLKRKNLPLKISTYSPTFRNLTLNGP